MTETWVVAVSGGPDSMMLLDVLRERNIRCVVAHVNYHKRDTSDRDMEIVSEYAKHYHLPLEIRHYDIETTENFQSHARVFRYQFFREVVIKYQAVGVAVAHHLDDDVETYVFQKERKMKSETVGLACEQVVENIKVWRPLLSLNKNEILEYCHDHGVDYGIDESNYELEYTRNRIRDSLRKLSAIEYNKLIDTMYQEKRSHDIYIKSIKDNVSAWGQIVPLDKLSSTDILRYWMRHHGVKDYTISEKYLKEMLAAFKKNKGVYEFDDWIVNAQYGSVYLGKYVKVNDVHTSFIIGEYNGYRFSNEGLKIEGLVLRDDDFPILVRNARSGDKIELRYGTKSLSRHFIDRKIPLIERKNCLVIENSLKQIVFVVGLGSDIHHYSNNLSNFVIKL